MTDVFNDAKRRARIAELHQELQGLVYELDDVIQEESGQIQKHLVAIRNVIRNELYSLRSILEDWK